MRFCILRKNGHSIARVNGKITVCGQTDCDRCEFVETRTLDTDNCDAVKTVWLMADYKPEITLTAREKHFVEFVETGWIAKDYDGWLSWHEEKPTQKCGEWESSGNQDAWGRNSIFDIFDFITDEEPWSVEELRKLRYLEYNPEDVAFKGGGSDE